MKFSSFTLTALLAGMFFLNGCSTAQMERLEWLGHPPPMEPVQPKMQSEPIQWPVFKNVSKHQDNPSSLWNKNSKDYFKDQRAVNVGDILTVRIQVNDKAELDNKTERTRTESDSTGAPNFFGLENKIAGLVPQAEADPANLISTNSNMSNIGEGLIEREEIIDTKMAAVVTDVLPNGNLVIYGSQEFRVNYEVRQLTVQGVIRPEDIDPNNEVMYSRIAEARISYGGKGIINDIQQPRIGNQIADIFSPW